MAKKAAADVEFNMSEAIREILTENPKLSSKETTDALLVRYPGAKINKNSFAVAFYTGRKKLGIGSFRRGAKVGVKKSLAAGKPAIDIAMIQSGAKFIRDVGSPEAALEIIKLLQVK